MKIKGNKGPILVLLATLVALLAATFVMPVSASSQPAPDEVIAWPGDEANHASYWEKWLGEGWTCEKVDKEGSFTTDHFYGAVITKGGQWNNVFYNVASGTDFVEVIRPDQPPAGISHYFVCDKSEKPTPTPTATPTPEPSSTPTPKPSKTPKPTEKPTVPPTDTLGQSSDTGSSSGGILVILVVLGMIALSASLLTPASVRRKK